MKLLPTALLALTIVLVGCAALSNPQGAAQGVKMIDKKGIYKVTCSGAVEEWANCYTRASQTCNGNYERLERVETPVGGRRELTFECKK